MVWQGLVGATLVVAGTTIDDAVWLVPYVTSRKLFVSTRVCHGVIFVGTLELLALLCSLTAQAVYSVLGTREDWIFGGVGAILCWTIAVILYVKKMLKKRRRHQQQEGATTHQPSSKGQYGAVAVTVDKEDEEEPSISFSPWTVASLTFLGALDEISYFPALLVGGVFSSWQLCLGTLLAACLILIIITMFLSQCKPLIEWLDTIPLYGIVGAFAIVLSGGVVVDLLNE